MGVDQRISKSDIIKSALRQDWRNGPNLMTEADIQIWMTEWVNSNAYHVWLWMWNHAYGPESTARGRPFYEALLRLFLAAVDHDLWRNPGVDWGLVRYRVPDQKP